MRVRHRLNGAERTVEIDSRLDDFTVADLAAALSGAIEEAGDGTGAGLSIDGVLARSRDAAVVGPDLGGGAARDRSRM